MSPYARPKQFLLAFPRSPLGVGALVLSIAVGVGVGMMGWHPVLASQAGLGMLGLCLAAGPALGLVQRSAVVDMKERPEPAWPFASPPVRVHIPEISARNGGTRRIVLMFTHAARVW
jgi:hypothetical protein